jgi:hypothetical protein
MKFQPCSVLAMMAAVALYLPATSQAFSIQITNSPGRIASTALFVKSRKARRMDQQRENKGRSQQFYKAMEDAVGKKLETIGIVPPDPATEEDGKTSIVSATGPPPLKQVEPDENDPKTAYMEEVQRRYEERPELSTMVVDEETGIEVIRQGQSVMDVVTRKAVKLSDKGNDYRLAQMFPGVPPEIRAKDRMDWNTVQVTEMVDRLRDACSVTLPDGSKGIPPHPSVANRAIDFCLANRDMLGYKMKRTLTRLQMRAMWQQDKELALELAKLSKNFLTLENHISGPFRQIIQDAEGRCGPNFGNMDLMSYCNGPLYERIGNYIVLKGMVAHWEKKVVDADYVEKTPQTKENFMSILARGDPKRYLPDPPILFTLKECTQVCAMAQQMCKAFIENEALFGDFPPEIVFLEEAFKIKGGTALRKYIIEDFCPARDITPEGLREGMRRFYQQLDNMQIDPYGDITNKVDDLHAAMCVGTPDERDPYTEYLANLSPEGPGYFQTYTFDHAKRSIVRFLDNQYPSASQTDLIDFGIGTPDDNKEEAAPVSARLKFLNPNAQDPDYFSMLTLGLMDVLLYHYDLSPQLACLFFLVWRV